jgi:hypothetical protein
MKKIKVKTGDLIKVPYSDTHHIYARVLVEGSYAFYDCPSISDIKDFDAIINSDILFICKVDVFAIQEGLWAIITNIPLDGKLQTFYPRYFNPLPFNQENVGFYKAYKHDIEEAIKKDWIKTGKLNLDGVYGSEHVTKRVNDYYNGKINEANTANISLFKNYLNIH